MKIKKIVIVILIGFMAVSGFAKKINGTVWFKDGSKKQVELKISYHTILFVKDVHWHVLMKQVKYTDESGNKGKLYPDDVTRIEFSDKKGDHTMVSINTYDITQGSGGSAIVFLPLIVEGTSSMYYYPVYNKSVDDYIDTPVLQKPDTKLKLIYPAKFKDDVSNYYFDCTELYKKVRNKDFKYKQIEEVVKYYNTKCPK